MIPAFDKTQIHIDNKPCQLLTVASDGFSVNVYAIPQENYDKYDLSKYNGSDYDSLPLDVRQNIDDEKYLEISVTHVIKD